MVIGSSSVPLVDFFGEWAYQTPMSLFNLSSVHTLLLILVNTLEKSGVQIGATLRNQLDQVRNRLLGSQRNDDTLH